MTRTQATMFSGGEGFGVGASAAGLRHLWGVEYDAKIAAVAEANGYRSIVASVCDVDYAALERPYHLHASPVCKNASVAKSDGEESPVDLETAQAVCRAIVALRPPVFTLENVRGYAAFGAFSAIVETLRAEGYGVTWRVLNSADYGVPQTRERLILRAVRGQDRPLLPTPTHARADKLSPMFDDRLPWVGWYAAIRDLIPTLPDSAFAPWQLARLPKEIRESVLAFGLEATARDITLRGADDPAPTLTNNIGRRPISVPRAFILDGTPNPDGDATQRDGEDPIFTVTAGLGTRRPARAFLAPNSTESEVRYADEPPHTITSADYKNMRKAYLMESRNSNQQYGDGLRDAHEPSTTVTTDHKPSHQPKAIMSGRVVRMTPRALMDFQSFPRSYILPRRATPRRLSSQEQAWLDRSIFTPEQERWINEWIMCDAALSTLIAGNAVPPLLSQRICEVP